MRTIVYLIRFYRKLCGNNYNSPISVNMMLYNTVIKNKCNNE